MRAELGEIVHVERLAGANGRGFDELFRIYRTTISADEQKSRLALESMAQSSVYRLYVAIGGNEAIVGFSIFYLPDARQFALLEYMAVDIPVQSLGIGGRLFLGSVATLEADEGPRAIMLEVDSDREVTDDYTTRVRRIKFYRRLGCRRIKDLAYIMPRVGRYDPPQMDIYAFGERADWVAKADLRDRLMTIYQGVYSRPTDDPNIETMLSPLGEIVRFE